MFLSIICLVFFLTLIVTGYSFNLRKLGTEEEFIERTGLVQISSVPSGATIEIDGGTPLLLRTNSSKALSVGEHEIVLTKDGYDSWRKKIETKEGLVYRLTYPRLFLSERTPEEVAKFEGISVTTVSPNMEKLILVQSGKLYMMELNNNRTTVKSLETTKTNGAEKTKAETVLEKIESFEEIEWSGNSERVLAKVNGELMVINIKNLAESVVVKDLTGELPIKTLRFETEVGERLIMLTENGELRELDLRGKKVSEALVSGVIRFDNDGERVVYLSKYEKTKEDEKIEETVKELSGDEAEPQEEFGYQIRAYRMGAEDTYFVAGVKSETAKIATMKYFQESLFAIATGEELEVYGSERWPEKKGVVEKIFEGEVGFEVLRLEKRGAGMVFSMSGEDGVKAVFDMEAGMLAKLSEAGVKSGWVDEFLRYEIDENGKFEVVDFDGLNRRELVQEGVNEKFRPVISGKWLYYFRGETLTREKIN